MEKFEKAIKAIIPILEASPPLAIGIYLLTAFLCMISVSTLLYYYINRPVTAKEPYPGFSQCFREVVAAERIKKSGALTITAKKKLLSGETSLNFHRKTKKSNSPILRMKSSSFKI